MKKTLILKFFIILLFLTNINAQTIVLDGKNMNSEKISNIANGAKVEIDEKALSKAKKAYQVLIAAASSGHKIYGLTVGVGLNKDKKMVNAKGELTKEVIQASTNFNKGLIYAHCGGVGDDLTIKESRAIMATRLNNILFGATGVQEKVIHMYKTLLNKNIIPAMPSKGSMGEADITILGHIGLAMLGEGYVYFNNKKMLTKEAFKKAKVEKISLFGKDALSIVSSNAYSSGIAGLALEELKQLSKVSKYLYALSLEALNGNIAPIHKETIKLRPFPHFINSATEISTILKGSYLWDKDDSRALQDPLSYRDSAYIIATLDSSIEELEKLMKIQWNSSDDNPGIAIDVETDSDKYQENKVYVNNNNIKGAVIPTSNFEPLPWVIKFEETAISLAHNSVTSAQRIIKLNNPNFTKLTRFLGTKNTIHAFGAMEKPFVSLVSKNQELANPISFNFLPVAGNIEDIATNAPEVINRVREQIKNLYYIYGIELLHATQAIDLRIKNDPKIKLADKTKKLYSDYRKTVDFLEYDRPLTEDFRNSFKFLKEYKF